MDYEQAFYSAFTYLGAWFAVYYSYTWAKVFLSLWIEDNPKAYKITGKIISVIFCLLGSALAALIVYLFFKSSTVALSAFIVFIICSLFAAYNGYQKTS